MGWYMYACGCPNDDGEPVDWSPDQRASYIIKCGECGTLLAPKKVGTAKFEALTDFVYIND